MSDQLPVPAADAGPAAPTPPGRRCLPRARVALFLALAADALQIALLPAVLGGALSPVDDFIDVLVAIAMVVLLGWHWAFLPTFLAEILPIVDLAPTWTVAVFIATRGRRDAKQAPTTTQP